MNMSAAYGCLEGGRRRLNASTSKGAVDEAVREVLQARRYAVAVRLAELAVDAALRESISATQAGELLHVSTSTISRRRANELLYAFQQRGRWRFASWQFVDSSVIPGAPEIVRAVKGKQAALVRAIMLAPRPIPAPDGAMTSPVEWLRTGGDVQPIIEVIEGFRS